MRIAVLGHTHYPIREPFAGGLEAHTAYVSEALAARGHEVTLFAKAGSSSASGRVDVRPILRADFDWDAPAPSGSKEAELDAADASACTEASGFDVVLNNSLSPVPYVALPDAAMLTICHTPATLTRVNTVVRSSLWHPGRRHAWVAVSAFTAAGWRDLLDPVPVGVVSNGIDLARWPLGTGAERKLVWSGRITPEKGTHVAIDAARAAGFPLIVAGPVSDHRYFETEIRPRLGPEVVLAGHLDHAALAALIGDARVFVNTAQWDEPFCLAVLEAMACGTPVAALDRGAVGEVIGTDGGCLAVDSAGLPAAIARAATRDRLGVRRRAERFALDCAVDHYLELLVSLEQIPVDPGVLGRNPAPLGDAIG